MTENLSYLLDTNIISELIRNPQGKLTDIIALKGEDRICTSIIVASELRFGAEKKGSAPLTRQLETVLSAIKIMSLREPADRAYAKLRTHLEKTGKPIGPNDMLIAAHALSLGLTLVTANEREFLRVPELAVENWLK